MFAFLRDINVLKAQVAMLMGQTKDKGVKKHVGRKLSYDQVRNIKLALRDGATQVSLARQYGVSAVTVGQIAHGELWKHVSI